jgi:hypothetical protein
MALRVTLSVFLAAAAALGGCGAAGGDEQSLVGAKHLPSDAVLDRETIAIVRIGGLKGGELLTYELPPGGPVTVTHSRYDRGSEPMVMAKEVLALPGEAAARARRLLRRLRPDDGASHAHSIPLGCAPITDIPHDAQIAFVPAGQRGNILLFNLPRVRDCGAPAAAEVRRVLDEAVSMLPVSRVARGFPANVQATPPPLG